jgi:hypothetical protein
MLDDAGIMVPLSWPAPHSSMTTRLAFEKSLESATGFLPLVESSAIFLSFFFLTQEIIFLLRILIVRII